MGEYYSRDRMLDRVRNTSEVEISFVRGLSYGRTGTGKTRFGGTFPKPLFLAADTEGGIVTLRKRGVDFIDISGGNDMLEALDELGDEADRGTLQWESVIIDSITIYCEQYIDTLVSKRRAESSNKQASMRKVDWGVLDAHLRAVTVAAHILPVNVWWMALEDEQKDEDTGKPIKGYPMLYGKRSAKMLASMDIVLYHEFIRRGANQPNEYRCHPKPYKHYDAKDRFDVLPDPMAPNFQVIKEAIGF